MGISLISLTFPSPKPSLSLSPKHPKTSHLPKHHPFSFIPKATLRNNKKHPSYENVQEVHNIEEFDTALIQAKDKLVLVEYISSRSGGHHSQTHPLTVELNRSHSWKNGVCFMLVKVDKSEETKELCRRESIEKVPHYNFHKNKEKIHEKRSRLKVEEFIRYALYYGNSHESVIQLYCENNIKKLMDDQKTAGYNKLIVLNLGLRNCEPCVNIYPTMVRLSAQMGEDVVFARLFGDDNGGRNIEFFRKKFVVRVPTFLFIINGEILGRYVGSKKAKLIREVLQYKERHS